MGISPTKQWIGPASGVLFIVVIGIQFGQPIGFEVFGAILGYCVSMTLMVLWGTVSIIFPAIMIQVFAIIVLGLFSFSKRYRFPLLIFFVSYFFSGLYWNPEPYLGIDFLLIAHAVMPTDMVSYIISIGFDINFYLAVTTFLITILSIITSQIVALVTTKNLESFKATLGLIVIIAVWSIVPSFLLLHHPYVASVIPYPIGPLVTLFILPFISRYYVHVNQEV